MRENGAAQKVVRGAGMGDWQGVSSHALVRVTVMSTRSRLNINKLVIRVTGLLNLVISSPK